MAKPFNPSGNPKARKKVAVGVKSERLARVIASEKLGRPLRQGEIAHHKDEDCQNDDPDNIEIMTRAEHMNLHRKKASEANRAKSGVPNEVVCPVCDELFWLGGTQRSKLKRDSSVPVFCSLVCFHESRRK